MSTWPWFANSSLTNRVGGSVIGRWPKVTLKGLLMPELSPSCASQTAEADTVAEILASGYHLSPTEITRLPIGQGTINYRAEAVQRRVFVKHYPVGTDLAAELAAIELSVLAGRHGIPVPDLVPAVNGQPIVVRGRHTISVWSWVEGHAVTDGFSTAQEWAAGAALGTIHRAFAKHPASRDPAPEVADWFAADILDIEATIDRLLNVITSRPAGDSFDRIAERTLTERRADLRAVPDLFTGLPSLSTQVLHGDYSAVNLLFRGDELTGVIDFRPPNVFLVAFELGRIAFDPRTVALHENWLSAARALVNAYLETNPGVEAADVQACGRIALLQLLTSLYGVKQHYLKPGLLQDDLDAFWVLRHEAARLLLDHLDDVEGMLASLAAHAGSAGRR